MLPILRSKSTSASLRGDAPTDASLRLVCADDDGAGAGPLAGASRAVDAFSGSR